MGKARGRGRRPPNVSSLKRRRCPAKEQRMLWGLECNLPGAQRLIRITRDCCGLPPFYREGTQGTKKLTSLPKVPMSRSRSRAGGSYLPSLVTASSRICPSSWKHPAPRPFRGAPHLAIAKSWRSEKLRIGKEAQGRVRPCRQGHTAWAMEGCRRTDSAAPHLE